MRLTSPSVDTLMRGVAVSTQDTLEPSVDPHEQLPSQRTAGYRRQREILHRHHHSQLESLT